MALRNTTAQWWWYGGVEMLPFWMRSNEPRDLLFKIRIDYFSENGQCLFVGTADGVSVIGWEPDRQFDNIESAWSILGDIQVFKNKLVR